MSNAARVRATPLPPEERRAAIIAATRPLVVAYGGRFTTKQVAEAAGIAEGTIFRIFDSKAALLHAVLDDLFDPSELCAAITNLRPTTLDEVTVGVIELIHAAVNTSAEVFTALAAQPDDDLDAHPHAKPPPIELHRQRAIRVQQAIRETLAPFADQLNGPLDQAASLLRSTALATSHPFLSDGIPMSTPEVAHLVLTGLARS